MISVTSTMLTPRAGEIVLDSDGRSISLMGSASSKTSGVPAYAATIHKSQGSEYSAVIIPVLAQTSPCCSGIFFYTGVTRGKRLVRCWSDKKAMAAVHGLTPRPAAVVAGRRSARCSPTRSPCSPVSRRISSGGLSNGGCDYRSTGGLARRDRHLDATDIGNLLALRHQPSAVQGAPTISVILVPKIELSRPASPTFLQLDGASDDLFEVTL